MRQIQVRDELTNEDIYLPYKSSYKAGGTIRYLIMVQDKFVLSQGIIILLDAGLVCRTAGVVTDINSNFIETVNEELICVDDKYISKGDRIRCMIDEGDCRFSIFHTEVRRVYSLLEVIKDRLKPSKNIGLFDTTS